MNYTAQLYAIPEDYDKGDDLRQIAQDLARFHELGITQWRGSFGCSSPKSSCLGHGGAVVVSLMWSD